MKKLITLLAIVIFITPVKSQSNLITLETENNADGSITLNANNPASTIYTIKVNFTSLTGFLNTGISNPYINSIGTGKVQVTKLTPDKNAGSRSLGYTYSYYAGMAYRKPPSNFTHYILPISVGKTTKVTKVEELRSILGVSPKEDLKVEHTDVQLPKDFKHLIADTSLEARRAKVYLKKRGITETELIKYNIGHATNGQYGNHIIVPSYDKQFNINYFEHLA